MKIPRDKYLQELQSVMHNGMIKIITGVRRCGKSYLLFELFKQSLLDNGVNEDHVIQVDLENRRSKDLRNPYTLLDYIDGHIVDNDMYYYYWMRFNLFQNLKMYSIAIWKLKMQMYMWPVVIVECYPVM